MIVGLTTQYYKNINVKNLHINKPRTPMITLNKLNRTWIGKPGVLRFRTWNVRTLYKPGALNCIIRITRNYHTEITIL